MDRTEGHDAGLSSKGVYEAIAMSEPNNASHWTWTPEYHDIKSIYRRTFFLIGKQTSRTNTNRGLPRNTLHVTSHPPPCSPESAPRRWLGPEILQPGGWCQTIAREGLTRSRQYQKIPSRARASSPTASPGHLEADKQRPSPSFPFNSKSVNRRENVFSPTNESETLVI